MKRSDKMMYLIELMNARHMSRTDLSDLSGVPESTLRDILTGKAQLDRCEAATLYSIAEALDVSIEDILLSYWDELEEANAPDTFAVHEEGTLMPFYLLVDATLSKLHKEGDLAVIRHIRANEWIEQFWDAIRRVGDEKYLLLFKARQADAITGCFAEYSRLELKRAKSRQTPIREQLRQAEEQVKKQPQRELTKEVAHGDR